MIERLSCDMKLLLLDYRWPYGPPGSARHRPEKAWPDPIGPGTGNHRLPRHVGFCVSRNLVSVSCILRSQWASSGDVSYVPHSSLEALGKVYVCQHTFRRQPTSGSARPSLGPTFTERSTSYLCANRNLL